MCLPHPRHSVQFYHQARKREGWGGVSAFSTAHPLCASNPVKSCFRYSNQPILSVQYALLSIQKRTVRGTEVLLSHHIPYHSVVDNFYIYRVWTGHSRTCSPAFTSPELYNSALAAATEERQGVMF